MVLVSGVGIGGVLAIILTLCNAVAAPGYAQVDEELGLEISKTLEGSEVVQVGQVLEFTIRIRNTGTNTITHLVIEDVFDDSVMEPASEGQYAEPDDPPASDPPGTISGNTITWDDVVENSSDQELGPGEEIVLKVYLRAIHPSEDLTTVNRAAIKEAISKGGKKESDVGEDEYNDDVGGNNATVSKKLETDPPIYAGMLVTYTIQVENDGQAALDSIPLKDTYNPGVLDFVRADPPPSSSNEATGVLEWNDLLTITGQDELAPGETIEVLVVYRALQAVDESTNEAEVDGASDKYGNELTPRQAEAPIRILPAATETPIPTGTPLQPTATATMSSTQQPDVTPTITPTLTLTSTSTPIPLPTTMVPTGIVVQPTATPRQAESDDDDDDDDEQEVGTSLPTSTPQPLAQQATAKPTETPTAVATETPTATPQQWVVVSRTATSVIPIPKELPNTSGEFAPTTMHHWSLLLLAMGVAGLLLVWWGSRAWKR